MKKSRRNHPKEFKLDAIELAKRIGIAKAATELGIHETSIRAWRKKFDSIEVSQLAGSDKKTYSQLEAEIRKLHKENGYLREINKVLKKSTAIFSIDHMGSLK